MNIKQAIASYNEYLDNVYYVTTSKNENCKEELFGDNDILSEEEINEYYKNNFDEWYQDQLNYIDNYNKMYNKRG